MSLQWSDCEAAKTLLHWRESYTSRAGSSTGGRDELDPEIAGMEVPGQNARTSTLRKEVSHLKRVLAEKTLEVDFFRSALQNVEARRQPSDKSGEKASTSKFGR